MTSGEFVAARTDEHVLQIIRTIQQERRAIPISATELSARAGCSPRTAQTAVKRLQESGRLKVLAEKGKPNRYEVVE